MITRNRRKPRLRNRPPIPAAGIRTIEHAIEGSSSATRRSKRTQTWSLVVITTDGAQERLVLGSQSAYKSKQPLDQLVAAINRVLRG